MPCQVSAASHVGERLGADQLAQRPPHDVGPLQPDARRERVVGLDDAELAVHDGDEIDERVEGVFEQAALAEDVVEQLDVLDADRQLPRQLARELEEFGVVERRRFGIGAGRASMTSVPRARRQPRSGATTRSAPELRAVQPEPVGRVVGRVVDRGPGPRPGRPPARPPGPAGGSGGRAARFRPLRPPGCPGFPGSGPPGRRSGPGWRTTRWENSSRSSRSRLWMRTSRSSRSALAGGV